MLVFGSFKCPMARSEAVNSAAVAAQPESYIDCMIVVAGNREKLTNATAAAQTAARFNDLEKLSQVSTAQALESVQSASSAANRAAYLIGVADPMSAPAVPGLIDQEELNTAVQAARACLASTPQWHRGHAACLVRGG